MIINKYKYRIYLAYPNRKLKNKPSINCPIYGTLANPKISKTKLNPKSDLVIQKLRLLVDSLFFSGLFLTCSGISNISDINNGW